MSEMEICGGWVIAAIDAQWSALLLAARYALAQVPRHGLPEVFIAIVSSLHQQFDLIIDIHGASHPN
jgi:hypothetical protein